jgi:hypothetical protein
MATTTMARMAAIRAVVATMTTTIDAPRAQRT